MNLITRPIIKKIKGQLEKGNIVVLIGARQVGKTSILKLLIQDLKEKVPSKSLFYFDLEKEELLEIFQSYRNLINYLQLQGASLKKKIYLFIDEFHYIQNPTKLLKILHDSYPNFKIVATGSSSLKISKKIKESLVGRKRIFKIYPLCFEEFLLFKKSPLKEVLERVKNKKLDITSPILEDFLREWEEFLIFGSYPKVTLTEGKEEKVEELAEIYHSYVEKDIKAFLKLENILAFNKLIKILASQIGSLANIHQLSNLVNISRETLERYLFVLENTFIIKLIPPFFTNKQKEIVKMQKVFFFDPGIRNFSLKEFKEIDLRPDKGALIENGVFSEMIKQITPLEDIYFWRTQLGREVDFILKSNGQLIPLEVKYQSFKSPKIPSSLKAFISQYQPKQAFVLTKDFSGEITYLKCQIKFLPTFLASIIPNLCQSKKLS
jgi:predicted AAA+ superfamily ATPase